MLKSIDIRCPKCKYVELVYVEIPDGEGLPDFVECCNCSTPAPRLLTAQIMKKEVEERVHGGELMANGTRVRQATGWEETRKQATLDKTMREAIKAKKYDVAASVGEELLAKRNENKKKL